MTNQLELALIQHETEGQIIDQRAVDGYINATALCKAVGRQWNHYWDNNPNQAFIEALSADLAMPREMLINSSRQTGTWVHPQVAIHLAQWLSPKFAVQVTKWVVEWMQGGLTPSSSTPDARAYPAIHGKSVGDPSNPFFDVERAHLRVDCSA